MSKARGSYRPRTAAALTEVQKFTQGQMEARDAAYRAALGLSSTQPLPSAIGSVNRHSKPARHHYVVGDTGRHSMAARIR
jgi:hypothetical protein